MEFQSSDYFIRFAISTGAFTTLVALLIIVLMLVVRLGRAYEHRVSSGLTEKWLEVLGGGGGMQADLTSLGRRTAFQLLRQWSVAYERAALHNTNPNAVARRRHLTESAENVRLGPFALHLLETGTNEEVMGAAIALGQLKAEKAWIPLKRRAATPHPFMSAVATEALVRIDADRAISIIVDTLYTPTRWPDHVLGRILASLSERQVHKVITGVAADENFDAVLHLFGALERVGNESAAVVLEWLIEHVHSIDDVLACCYAALQEEQLDAALNVYRDGMSRIRVLREIAAEERVDSILEDEPIWIQRQFMLEQAGDMSLSATSAEKLS